MSPEQCGTPPPSATLPKAARIRKRPEFQAIQQHGQRFPTRDLIILWREGRTPVTRLGITVSRRVAKQAARRNRIKRWIREAFRRLPERTQRRPLDIVVIARSTAVTGTYTRLQQQLQTFWQETGTLGSRPPKRSKRRRRRPGRPSGAS